MYTYNREETHHTHQNSYMGEREVKGKQTWAREK